MCHIFDFDFVYLHLYFSDGENKHVLVALPVKTFQHWCCWFMYNYHVVHRVFST